MPYVVRHNLSRSNMWGYYGRQQLLLLLCVHGTMERYETSSNLQRQRNTWPVLEIQDALSRASISDG